MEGVVFAPNYVEEYPWYYNELENRLEQSGYELNLKKCTSEKEAIDVGSDADILYAYRFPITETLISSLPNLRMITAAGIGVDHIDVEAATERGILVTNNPEHNVEAVAGFTIGLLYAIGRKIVKLDREVASGGWQSTREITEECRTLRGQTVGIIGFGNIGTAVAQKAEALGMNALVYDAPDHAITGLSDTMGATGWADLLTRSDFVTIHTPLTEETRHMIGDEEFEMMKTSASVINTSRGGVIDEEHLIEALDTGKIEGAALDVLENEPPDPRNPLLERDDVIVTGHEAGVTLDSNENNLEELWAAIDAYIEGYWPENVVNPRVDPKADLDKQGGTA